MNLCWCEDAPSSWWDMARCTPFIRSLFAGCPWRESVSLGLQLWINDLYAMTVDVSDVPRCHGNIGILYCFVFSAVTTVLMWNPFTCVHTCETPCETPCLRTCICSCMYIENAFYLHTINGTSSHLYSQFCRIGVQIHYSFIYHSLMGLCLWQCLCLVMNHLYADSSNQPV